MKTLMFGRRVISSTYGWALARGAHDVKFYVRPGRAAGYGDTIDLDLLDLRRRPWGEQFMQSWPVRYREDLPTDHDFDLIMVSVPHNRLSEAASFLAPRIGSATVLTFGNVWAEPLDAISPLPVEQVVWGFPGAGERLRHRPRAPRHPQPLGRLRNASATTYGARAGRPPRVPSSRVPDRRAARHPRFWLHFTSDTGLQAQAVRVGTLAGLIGATSDLRLAMLTTRELLSLLQARGVDLRRHRTRTLQFLAPTQLAASALS